MATQKISQLYYITHIKNLPSILINGVLSHEEVERRRIQYEPIYDREIVETRRRRTTPDGRSLWNFANLFFQPRNAMLYRVLRHRSVDEIAVLAVNASVLQRPDSLITLGNAASEASAILPAREGKKELPQILKWINNEYWTEEMGLKRKMMAECLVPAAVPSDLIQTIYVANHETVESIRKTLSASPTQIPEIVPEPYMFFEPVRRFPITPMLTVLEGDMFFSRMQTLTVSVNTVGVMGKGLASRAKYQFPDVYVRYQDACRSKRLAMGKPYLYKRESSVEHQLADDPSSLGNANSGTWFLLFPTKRHWREQSDITGIERGLAWLRDNYREEGIRSLAMPALGCGLGRLDWRDVGPLLCRYLSDFDVPVEIYLPAEKNVPGELLGPGFLLPGSS